MDEIIKITLDKEKAKSILKMVELRVEMLKLIPLNKYASPLVEEYYEIIKELITAILLIEGYKTLSHIELIRYIENNRKEFTEEDISVLDNLRILRNRVTYEGFFINTSYLERNEISFKEMIKKLKNLISMKLK